MNFKSIVIAGTCLAMTLNCGTSDQRQKTQNESEVSYIYNNGQANGYGYGYGYGNGNNYGFYNGQNYNGAAIVIGGILIVGAVFLGARAFSEGDDFFRWGNKVYAENSWITPLRKNGDEIVDNAGDLANKRNYYERIWDLENIEETADGMKSRMQELARIASPRGPMDLPFSDRGFNRALTRYVDDFDPTTGNFDAAVIALKNEDIAESFFQARMMSEMAESMSPTEFKSLLRDSSFPDTLTQQTFIDAKFNDPRSELFNLRVDELWIYAVDSGVFNTNPHITNLRNRTGHPPFAGAGSNTAENTLILEYMKNLHTQHGHNAWGKPYQNVISKFEGFMADNYNAVRPKVMKKWEKTLDLDDTFNKLSDLAHQGKKEEYRKVKTALIEKFKSEEFRKWVARDEDRREAFNGIKNFYRLFLSNPF